MTIHESKGIKGWISFILAGMVLGFFIGLFLINKISEDFLLEFLVGMTIIGGIIGIGFGYLFTRNTSMEESYEEPFRSKDLDSFYRQEKDPITEKSFIKAIPDFNEHELINALTMRYYDLTDISTDSLINEVRKRSIEKSRIERIYGTTKYYSNITYGRCPGCNSNRHLIMSDNEITNCLICGYNIEFDNPKSVSNRIRWRLGFHSGSKLKLSEMKKMIFETD